MALLFDRLWGEPPSVIHPVVWMGRYFTSVGRRLPDHAPAAAFLLGATYWLIGAILVALAYGCVGDAIAKLPAWFAMVLTALLLKPLFALKMLLGEVVAVEKALACSVEQGRSRLRMIVSRDTTRLTAAEVRESSLESLAENLSDSVVAPLFWFALLGLPGAAVYRFANTADAMWGYRGRWEWAGKFAARADDVLNWMPARLTALVLVLVGPHRMVQWKRLRTEAGHTLSPNSGWPMAALALSLNVRLRKPGVYVLNAVGLEPAAANVATALRRVEVSAWLAAAAFALAILCRDGIGYAGL